jgi:hypothetical protein
MSIEKWMYDILTEDQRCAVKDKIFEQICSEIGSLKFKDIDLDIFIEDCGDRLDRDAITKALQKNIESTLEKIEIKQSDYAQPVRDVLEEAFANAETTKISELLIKKLAKTLS